MELSEVLLLVEGTGNKERMFIKIKGPIFRLTPLLTNPLNSGTKLQF